MLNFQGHAWRFAKNLRGFRRPAWSKRDKLGGIQGIGLLQLTAGQTPVIVGEHSELHSACSE